MSKVALVVGAGQSLGAYLVNGLANDGYRVVVADIDSISAQNVAVSIGEHCGMENVMAIQANATNEDDVIRMIETVKEKWGKIDLMVYNAGWAAAHKIDVFPVSDWDRSVAINLNGYFLCAREVSKLMIEKGTRGRIITIHSKSGKVGSKHNSGYSAAKFGAVGLTQSLALDLAEHGITVHSLMLGNLLNSPMFDSLLPQYAVKLGIPEEQVKQSYIDKVPLKRGCEFSDVMNVLRFYASEGAEYCTGQSINITGGQVMF